MMEPQKNPLFSMSDRGICLIITGLLVFAFLTLPVSQVLAKDGSPALFRNVIERWTGDFDEMVDRNKIRVLVPFSKTFYFLDRGRQRGLSYDLFKIFEDQINKDLKRKNVRVNVIFIPVDRDELIPKLLKGEGDIAVGALTITPKRKKLVDFSDPFLEGVQEIVVTGPSSPRMNHLDDLTGQTIHVRRSSSYYESLVRLNAKFLVAGKTPMALVPADEFLEDEDLLELVNAGLIPMIVMDSPKAEFWSKIFEHIRLHSELAVNSGGKIAWAFRKNSPKLQTVMNQFVSHNKKGSLIGNMLFNRYLKNTAYVKNSLADSEREKFESMVHLLQKYSKHYDFDWVLAGAVGYQESGLDQRKRSAAGAIGVMQLLPSTARDPQVNIPDIEQLEPNIHAGVKYLHFLHDRYFAKTDIDQLNQWLLTIAAYNAGPAKIRKLRREAESMNLDPNIWFRNVEFVAAKRIGRETVQYVSNIYKYYLAYRLIIAKQKLKSTGKP
jgi:membrane-bound lytic murein transglycosylase MltF